MYISLYLYICIYNYIYMSTYVYIYIRAGGFPAHEMRDGFWK